MAARMVSQSETVATVIERRFIIIVAGTDGWHQGAFSLGKHESFGELERKSLNIDRFFLSLLKAIKYPDKTV